MFGDWTVTITCFAETWGWYNLSNSFCRSSGVLPAAVTSPTRGKTILPSVRICWVLLSVGELGRETATVSPSRRTIWTGIVEDPGASALADTVLEGSKFG